MVKFKNFSGPLSVFQVLFKANFIFKDFSRQSCIFKYFSSMCKPCKVSEAHVEFVRDLPSYTPQSTKKHVITRFLIIFFICVCCFVFFCFLKLFSKQLYSCEDDVSQATSFLGQLWSKRAYPELKAHSFSSI